MNPTQAAVEERIAALEGGVGALLVSSRPGRRDPRAAQHRRGRRPHRLQPEPLRRHLQPVPLHVRRSWASRSPSSRTPTTSTAGGRPSSPTRRPSSPRRSPTRRTTSSTSRALPASPTRPVCRWSWTTPWPRPYLIRPHRVGSRHRGPLGHEVPRRARNGGRRRHRRLRQLRLRCRSGAVPELQPAGPELPRPGLRPRPRCGQRTGRQPGVHPQGPRPAPARPRQRCGTVQRVPDRPGPGDPQPAYRASRGQRQGRRRVAGDA